MQSIDTLSDFLTVAGSGHSATTAYCIYDLSRRVQRLDNHEFARIERGEAPFPTPRQQHAFLGVVFWNTTKANDPYIWFIKLPLDERGLFQHAARQHFLSIIVAALDTPEQPLSPEEQDKILAQNPYIFTPDEPRRAAFHALVSAELNHPPSIYYEDAQAWLARAPTAQNQTEPESAESWQNLGIQGIHDVCTRDLNNSQIQHNLMACFSSWPTPLQQALVEAIEHQNIPAALAQHWRNELKQAVQDQSYATDYVLTRLRLLASHAAEPASQNVVKQLLARLPSQQPDRQDILLALGARCWPALATPENCAAFLTAAAAESDEVFVTIFRDLVMLPALRGFVLNLFRQPELAPELQQALTKLAQRTRSSS